MNRKMNVMYVVWFGFCFFSGCVRISQQSSQVISVRGSETVLDVSKQWAENYVKHNSDVEVQVSGGGSGAGIASLINGTTDLVLSSRDVTDEEKALLRKQKKQLKEWIVALDAVTVYTHKRNPVKRLSLLEIRDIFSGKIKNWKDLGGRNVPIVLYGRDSSSGTRQFFQEVVMNKENFSIKTIILTGTAAMLNAVAMDEKGIGYSGASQDSRVSIVALSKNSEDSYLLPKEGNVANKKYCLAREIKIFSLQSAIEENTSILSYVSWILSQDGQKHVRSGGFFPVT